jgi:dipeptidyl aminopeptidase/acylaminoacyl peptidase
MSAREACAEQYDYAGLVACRYGLIWVEYQPEDGCNRLVRLDRGQRQVLTPPGFSVRSRVHEYGGGAFCVAGDRILFVNQSDQQIWLQPLGDIDAKSEASHCLRLTHRPDTRYGDLLYDGPRRRVIAVAEQHFDRPSTAPPESNRSDAKVENTLVAVSLQSARQQLLAAGNDFYSSPCLSPDGRELAWLAWDHPHQPWTRSRLFHARLDRAGYCAKVRELSVGGDESLFQPGFDATGVLHVVSDGNGWWNLYRQERGGHWHNVCELAAEFALAQWQLGLKTWLRRDKGDYVCALVDQGRGRLVQIVGDQQIKDLAPDYGLVRALCTYNDQLYCIAQAADAAVAVLQVEAAGTVDGMSQGAWLQVRAGGERAGHPVALPQVFSCRVAGNEQVHGFFYQPIAAAAEAVTPGRARGDEWPPPLLIMTHGGPTATSYPVYRAAVQYWCSQGFAVLDLNYRGSAGYGRAYRHRLCGNWGHSDVQDVAAAMAALGDRGSIDPQRVFIRGNSAGGYTTLSALAGIDGLRAGASLYGVSDPLSLGKVTHKFESCYLDWLIGDPVAVPELYQARSPLANADRIHVPVIFFQGMQDKVVLPDQTLRMSAALRARGIDTELRLFEDEGHGFRQLDNQIQVLEQELAFYRRYL